MKNLRILPAIAVAFALSAMVPATWAIDTQAISSVPAILGAWPTSSNFTITANSSITGNATRAGLPVQFSVVSGNASVSGPGNNTITVGSTIGPVVLSAFQPGNSTVSPATPITTTFYAGPPAGTVTNTTFVITNNTTISPNDIYVSFMGAIPATTPAQTYGNGTAFSGNPVNSSLSYYTLANMTGSLTVNGTQTTKYTFSMNSYSGGRIFISYGKPVTSPPDSTFDAPYGVWEMTIYGNLGGNGSATAGGATFSPPPLAYSPSSNFDISYVDGVSIPMRTTVRNPDWTVQTTSTTNPVWTDPGILSATTAQVPSDARITGNGTLTINGTSVDLSQKVVRIISPSFPVTVGGNATLLYHPWDSLLNTLISGNSTLTVGSYRTSPTNQALQPYNLAGVLFGFAGGGSSAYPNQAPNMLNPQDYSYAATFTSNLNPSGNATLASFGVGNGTAGVHLSGNLISVGPATCPPFDIYITKDQMNTPQGIYGSNPKYLVYSTGNATTGTFASYETAGIQNDLSGRMVGDLMAGIVLGWANSTTSISAKAAATGLNTANVTLSSDTLGEISTGEFFYQVSLAAAQTPAGNNSLLRSWVGGGIQTNPDYYDIFSYAVFDKSVAYGTAFGDRFQGKYSPDTSWYSSNPPPNTGGNFWPLVGFAEIELLPPSFPPATAGGPTISLSGTLSPFTTTNGTASAAQTFSAGGTSLTANISVTSPPSFELSTNNSTYSTGLSLPSANGTVSDTTIYVRLAASAPVGTPSGQILLSSSNATTQSLTANGTVTSGSQSPYNAWLAHYPSLTGNATLGTADPDGDGLSNDLEFAFDGDPAVPTSSLLGISASGGNVTVTFVARKTNPPGASYQVQSTTNLVSGFLNDNSVTPVASGDQTGILLPSEYQRMQFTAAMSGSKVFYRVKATLSP